MGNSSSELPEGSSTTRPPRLRFLRQISVIFAGLVLIAIAWLPILEPARAGRTAFAVCITIVVLTLLWALQRFSAESRRRETILSRERADLAAKTEQLETTLAGMSNGVMMVDGDLRLVAWNARFPEYVGVPPSLLRVGLPLQEILRAQATAGEFGAVDVEVEVARRIKLIEEGEAVGTIVRTRPNGMTLELNRNPLPSGGLVTMYTDITARLRTEERMREAEKMAALGTLTAGIAHDFNNLLSAITLNAGMVARRLGNEPENSRNIEMVLASARRGAQLVNQLLAFSRRQPLEPVRIDPNSVIENMDDLLQTTVGRAIRYERRLDPALWKCLADVAQLESVILNLAINARDAMADGGVLTITTANVVINREHEFDIPPGEYIGISVADTGQGMPEDVKRSAFQPFFTTKPPGQGSGLGLSQAYGFAKQSGGTVSIDSQIGKGTTITILLPRAEKLQD